MILMSTEETFSMSKVILFFAIVILLLHLPAASASQKCNGWVMDQISEEFGISRTEVTHDALRLQTEEFTVIVQGPKYDMCLLNNKTHRYLVTSNYNDQNYKKNFEDKFDLQKGHSDTICGHKANRYTVFKKERHLVSVEFWTTDDLSTTKGLNDACTTYFSMAEMPPGYGLLLRCLKLKLSGVKYRFVDTTSIKPAYIPTSTFTHPKNYERVKGFVDLQATRHEYDKDVNSLFKEPDEPMSPAHKKEAK